MIPLEIERKFLIVRPREEELERLEGCICYAIVQTYLRSQPGIDERVRMRSTGNRVEYFHTCKQHLSPMVRTEEETVIDEMAYTAYLDRADPAYSPLEKTRFCIPYAGQMLEIDVYPSMHSEAILEIELPTEDTPVSLPPFLEVIKEVTGDKQYSNRRMAKNHSRREE